MGIPAGMVTVPPGMVAWWAEDDNCHPQFLTTYPESAALPAPRMSSMRWQTMEETP
jgi:hypothetical protein